MATSLLEKRLEQVVEDIDAIVERGPGRRYPAHVRERVVAVGRSLRDQGWSWVDLADAFGVTDATLKRWFADAEFDDDTGFQEVAVTPDGFTLVSPSGWRVEGLSRDDLAALVGT